MGDFGGLFKVTWRSEGICSICCEFCILNVENLLTFFFVWQGFSLHSAGRDQSASFIHLILALISVEDRNFPIIPMHPGANLPTQANSCNSPRRRSARTRSTSNMSFGMTTNFHCLQSCRCVDFLYKLLTFFFFDRYFYILTRCFNSNSKLISRMRNRSGVFVAALASAPICPPSS